jgi:signal peptidase II
LCAHRERIARVHLRGVIGGAAWFTPRLRCVAEPTEPTALADESFSPAAAESGPRVRLVLLLAIAAVLLTADVISKLIVVAKLSNRGPLTLIPSVLDLELTRNPGAAFGFAAGATVIFTLVAAAVVVFIVRAARKLKSTGWAWALGLLLGGALGNLGDRIFRAPSPLRGHVVDWIHLHHWPVFNIADSGVVVGGVLAVLLSMRGIHLDGTRTVPGKTPPEPDAEIR